MNKLLMIIAASFCVLSAQSMQKGTKSDLSEKEIQRRFQEKELMMPVQVDCGSCLTRQMIYRKLKKNSCEFEQSTFTLHCKNCSKTTIFWDKGNGVILSEVLE